MIRRPEVIAGVMLEPAPERAFGGGRVIITAERAELDRDELEQLRDVIDEALQ